MPSRGLIAVGVIAAAVVVAFALLAVKVQNDPKVELDAEQLARARAYHEQLERQQARAAPALPGDSDWRADFTERGAAADDAGGRAHDEGVVQVDRPPRPQLPRAARMDDPPQLQPAESDKSPREVRMDDANSMYDRADYEASREAALAVLQDDPNNVRMLRIVVSASCIMAEPDVAEDHFARLERPHDRRQMSVRCKRYGVDLEP